MQRAHLYLYQSVACVVAYVLVGLERPYTPMPLSVRLARYSGASRVHPARAGPGWRPWNSTPATADAAAASTESKQHGGPSQQCGNSRPERHISIRAWTIALVCDKVYPSSGATAHVRSRSKHLRDRGTARRSSGVCMMIQQRFMSEGMRS